MKAIINYIFFMFSPLFNKELKLALKSSDKTVSLYGRVCHLKHSLLDKVLYRLKNKSIILLADYDRRTLTEYVNVLNAYPNIVDITLISNSFYSNVSSRIAEAIIATIPPIQVSINNAWLWEIGLHISKWESVYYHKSNISIYFVFDPPIKNKQKPDKYYNYLYDRFTLVSSGEGINKDITVFKTDSGLLIYY